MLYADLGMNRLGKKTEQTSETNEAVEFSANPQDNIYSKFSNNGIDNGRSDAKNILTGTVIVACIIKTSDTAARVELSGNDMKMYDNSYTAQGTVRGDTSTLSWIRSDDPTKYFTMEKRVSLNDDLDNVWSFYASAPATGKHNWMFFGRDGIDTPTNKNVSVIRFAVNGKSTDVSAVGKPYGSFAVEYDEESVSMNVPLFAGSSRNFIGGGLTGSSSYISASDGGVTGLSYYITSLGLQYLMLYLLDETKIMVGADMIPDGAGYDIGSAGAKFGTFYGSVSACPLPTVPDALEIVRRIPEPTNVGDRGHYGDRLYFDDLTFPKEILYTNDKGNTDLEHNNLLGFLMKAVVELTKEVDELKKIINK